MEYGLCGYTSYAGNSGGSLERTRQTTVAILVDTRMQCHASVAMQVC